MTTHAASQSTAQPATQPAAQPATHPASQSTATQAGASPNDQPNARISHIVALHKIAATRGIRCVNGLSGVGDISEFLNLILDGYQKVCVVECSFCAPSGFENNPQVHGLVKVEDYFICVHTGDDQVEAHDVVDGNNVCRETSTEALNAMIYWIGQLFTAVFGEKADRASFRLLVTAGDLEITSAEIISRENYYKQCDCASSCASVGDHLTHHVF